MRDDDFTIGVLVWIISILLIVFGVGSSVADAPHF